MKTKLFYFSVILLLCAVVAAAQTTCIPRADGVPGTLFQHPPNWWDPTPGEPFYNTNIDAPSWRGAFGLGYPLGAATTEEVHFRALHRAELGKEYIYLSWYGKVVPDLTTLGVNKMIVGFSPAGGGPAFEFNVTPNVTSLQTASPAYSLQVSVSTGGPWTAYVGPAPKWLNGNGNPATDGTGRIWVINTPNNQWAVHLRVPVSAVATANDISDGVPINPASFNMWFEFRAGAMSGPFGFIPYKFPRTIADADPFSDEPPPVANWETMHLNSTATVPDPGCSMDGVGITSSDIGSMNADQNSISLLQPNILFARPFNHSMNTPANNVRARFRIANWGNGLTWEDVPNPNVNLWIDVGPPAGVPAGGTNIPQNSSVTIQFPYNISDPTAKCERCQYETYYAANTMTCGSCSATTNNKKLDHQCMLVELTGPGVNFLNDSVYTNMNFVNASTFSDTAEINLNGLSGSLARDVYLYVESYNMPAARTGGGGGDQPPPGVVPQQAAANKARMAAAARPSPFDVNRPRDQRHKELQEMLRSGQLTLDDVAHNMPTYIVHAYYDSGIRNTAAGTPRAVLRPMQSFGYFVLHDGQPDGWITNLQGAQQIAPNWYKITTPASGVTRIHPVIQSVGGPSQPGGSPGRFRVFLDAGPNFPQGDFNTFVDGKLSVNAGLEAFVGSNTSIEGILGYHAFKVPFVNAPHIWQLSLNLKQYFGPGPLHFFLNAGGGAYRFDPGSTTKLGGNVGAGLLWDISSTWGFEGVYNFHTINTGGSKTEFSTLQVGIRHSLF